MNRCSFGIGFMGLMFFCFLMVDSSRLSLDMCFLFDRTPLCRCTTTNSYHRQ